MFFVKQASPKSFRRTAWFDGVEILLSSAPEIIVVIIVVGA